MKYVVLTGAYGGMGKAVAEKLKESGYFVFAIDKKVEEKEDGIYPIQADITNEDEIKQAYLEVQKVTNEVYAILHFAGVYALDSLVEMSEERYKKIFDINVFGAYRVNKIFLPLLSRGSKILITTSELAPLDPLPFTGVYAITKSTLDKYAYSLRMEVQLLGISVTVLRPGAVKTNLLDVSTKELDQFIENTKIYSCNAKRFKNIVNKVEARHVTPQKLGKKVDKILSKRKPRQVYKLNRNPLLLLLNVLPKRLQTYIIKKVLQ